MAIGIMAAAGGNGYGNTTNFVMLLVAVLPFVGASIYISDEYRLAKAAILIFLTYAGLLVYPRGGLILITIALISVFAFFSYKTKTLRWAIPITLTLIVLIHVPTGGAVYYLNGIRSFFLPQASLEARQPTAKDNLLLDAYKPTTKDNLQETFTENSGTSRAEAMQLGITIAKKNWLAGVGTSMYPRIDPEFTSPHSMLIFDAICTCKRQTLARTRQSRNSGGYLCNLFFPLWIGIWSHILDRRFDPMGVLYCPNVGVPRSS
jgi:hypothetical protein